MSDLEFLQSTPALRFLSENVHSDIARLVLNPPSQFKEKIALLADQISSRRKAVGKHPAWVRQDGIIWPPPVSIEQSSSELTAKYKRHLVKGEVVVDLTGGMGADLIELSGGFKKAIYVERDKWLCELFTHNTSIFGVQAAVHNISAEDYLSRTNTGDLGNHTFFLDPARRTQGRKTVLLEDCEPDALRIVPALVSRGAHVLLKTSPLLDIKSTLRSLSHVSHVHIVAVKNEVKEVLYRFDPTLRPDPEVLAVDLTEGVFFPFTYADERGAITTQGEVLDYLFEPNAAVMKAGAFRLVSERYDMKKLDSNSHLYTSNRASQGFPGRQFSVIKLLTKEDLKSMRGCKMNVISRNHPLSTDQLKKKYSIKDGGSQFLIGTRQQGKPILVLCELLLKPSDPH